MWRQQQDGAMSFEITGAGGTDAPLQPSEGAQHCQHLDFRLLLSRTAREHISAMLCHQLSGSLLQQPQEANTSFNTYLASCIDFRVLGGHLKYFLGNKSLQLKLLVILWPKTYLEENSIPFLLSGLY